MASAINLLLVWKPRCAPCEIAGLEGNAAVRKARVRITEGILAVILEDLFKSLCLMRRGSCERSQCPKESVSSVFGLLIMRELGLGSRHSARLARSALHHASDSIPHLTFCSSAIFLLCLHGTRAVSQEEDEYCKGCFRLMTKYLKGQVFHFSGG